MRIKEAGIILFTEHYEQAVEYYVNQIGLKLRLQNHKLAFLDFGNSYLLIEGTGKASPTAKTRDQSSVCFRIDVYDFDQAVEELRGRGVQVEVKVFEWGTIGIIVDPEGNVIEIKDGMR